MTAPSGFPAPRSRSAVVIFWSCVMSSCAIECLLIVRVLMSLKYVGIDDVFEQAPVVLHCIPEILRRGRSVGIAHGDGVSDAVIFDHRRVIHRKVGRALLKIRH